jgi:toxin ParE1/3/4
MEDLAAETRTGRAVDDVRRGYFRYAVGSHLIFYRRSGHMIDIIRILHQRMDVGRHL